MGNVVKVRGCAVKTKALTDPELGEASSRRDKIKKGFGDRMRGIDMGERVVAVELASV